MQNMASFNKTRFYESRRILISTQLTSFALLYLISPTFQASIQHDIDPNAFKQHRVVLYNGTSLGDFIELCSSGGKCPLDNVTRADLKVAQMKTLRAAQERVRLMLDFYNSPIRNLIKLVLTIICYALAFYLVVWKKHIDFKLFGREWVFDGSYGFHAKILKRMKFELKKMTPEEYAFTVKKRWEAAEKLRQAFKKHDLQMARELEGDVQDSSLTSLQEVSIEAQILASSKKQRIIRKKLQQRFEDAKQKYVLDERKKFRDEDAIVASEIRRLETQSQARNYHQRRLNKFKELSTEADKKIEINRLTQKVELQAVAKAALRKSLRRPKTSHAHDVAIR